MPLAKVGYSPTMAPNSLWTCLLSRVVKDDILSYVSEKPQRLSSDARMTLHELGKKLGAKFQASQGRPSN